MPDHKVFINGAPLLDLPFVSRTRDLAPEVLSLTVDMFVAGINVIQALKVLRAQYELPLLDAKAFTDAAEPIAQARKADYRQAIEARVVEARYRQLA